MLARMTHRRLQHCDYNAKYSFALESHHESAVAAAARAPFLFGLKPGFFRLDQWQELSPTAATFTIAWENFCRSTQGRRVFPLLPRFRVASVVGSFAPPEDPLDRAWMNPAYLVGSAAGAAYRQIDLLEAAQNFFPEWSNRPSSVPATEEKQAIRTTGIEFECDCPEQLQRAFAELGVNALNTASFERSDFLENLTCAARGGPGSGCLTLAQALAWCDLVNRIHERVQRER